MEEVKPIGNDKIKLKTSKQKKSNDWVSSLRDVKYSLNFLMRNQSHKYDHEILKKTFEDTDDDLSRASEELEDSTKIVEEIPPLELDKLDLKIENTKEKLSARIKRKEKLQNDLK